MDRPTSPLIIKLIHGDDLRRVPSASVSSFDVLHAYTASVFRLLKDSFALKYEDSDGDLVTVGCEFDLQMAVMEHRDVLRLQVIGGEHDANASAPPQSLVDSLAELSLSHTRGESSVAGVEEDEDTAPPPYSHVSSPTSRRGTREFDAIVQFITPKAEMSIKNSGGVKARVRVGESGITIVNKTTGVEFLNHPMTAIKRYTVAAPDLFVIDFGDHEAKFVSVMSVDAAQLLAHVSKTIDSLLQQQDAPTSTTSTQSPPATWQPVTSQPEPSAAPFEYKEELEHLMRMGFDDTPRMRDLLVRYEGRVANVIDRVV